MNIEPYIYKFVYFVRSKMDERIFEEEVEKAIIRNVNQINHYEEPPETFTMTPMQASFIEKELNMKK